MGLFDDLTKTITDAGQSITQKGRELTDSVKLNSSLNEREKEMKEVLAQIGSKYAELHSSDNDPAFADLLAAYSGVKAQIDQIRKQINVSHGSCRRIRIPFSRSAAA